MPGGHPTTYTDEISEKTKEYIECCPDALPSVAGLAVYLGVSRSTVYKWKDEQQEFSDILEQLLSTQERLLLNNGLTGDFNATITKLVLSKHGYTEKQEIEQTTLVATEAMSDQELESVANAK